MHDIKILHLESTDVCQLACPACSRETDYNFNKNAQHHLSLSQILKVFSQENIANLDKMFMCGNYGDPAAGNHTLEIYSYFKQTNPNIVLGMNTNGALRNADWWRSLAHVFNHPEDYVVFSIDGLEDTNHLYRVNCNWDKLMTNAEAYILAGGSAHWDMLVYKHNEHQVDAAEKLARKMGFSWFRAKVSKRPLTANLEFPVIWQRPAHQSGKIKCIALKDQSTFIDAQGRISPCCWLGRRQINFITDIKEVSVTWDTDNPDVTCVNSCSVQKNITNFESQWQREVKLN